MLEKGEVQRDAPFKKEMEELLEKHGIHTMMMVYFEEDKVDSDKMRFALGLTGCATCGVRLIAETLMHPERIAELYKVVSEDASGSGDTHSVSTPLVH